MLCSRDKVQKSGSLRFRKVQISTVEFEAAGHRHVRDGESTTRRQQKQQQHLRSEDRRDKVDDDVESGLCAYFVVVVGDDHDGGCPEIVRRLPERYTVVAGCGAVETSVAGTGTTHRTTAAAAAAAAAAARHGCCSSEFGRRRRRRPSFDSDTGPLSEVGHRGTGGVRARFCRRAPRPAHEATGTGRGTAATSGSNICFAAAVVAAVDAAVQVRHRRSVRRADAAAASDRLLRSSRRNSVRTAGVR